MQCIDGDDVIGHLEALQGIADANGGTRASGTPGYDASADYVAGLLEEAGFAVQRQVFDFSLFTEVSSTLTVAGAPVDTQTFEYSGSGEIVDGNVIPVGVVLGEGNTATSACEDPTTSSGSTSVARTTSPSSSAVSATSASRPSTRRKPVLKR